MVKIQGDGVQELVEGLVGVSCGGEGNHIRFWHDSWSGRLPLNDLFPDLFECSVEKEALIYDVLVSSSHGRVRSWNLQFRRAFHDWGVGG